jgi:ribosome maturation factor RimP
MALDLREILLELVNRLVSDQPLYLVDLELKGTTAAPIIWIYLESEKGGVSVDVCASLSREIVFHLENRTDVPEKFTLNVSSPGLDRPLTDPRQFVSNKGRMAQVKHHANGVTTTLKGRLTDASATGFILTDDKGVAHDIAYAEGRDVKIIPVFK